MNANGGMLNEAVSTAKLILVAGRRESGSGSVPLRSGCQGRNVQSSVILMESKAAAHLAARRRLRSQF